MISATRLPARPFAQNRTKNTGRGQRKRPEEAQISPLPRLVAKLLISGTSLLYGHEPSYRKFRALEVIARAPYHSWEAAAFFLLTFFYADERRALALAATTRFARTAQDNETLHVVVVSGLARQAGQCGFWRDTAVPLALTLAASTASFLLFLANPPWSFEVNAVLEAHAYEQYGRFLAKHGEALKKTPISGPFLAWHGRATSTEYAFFRSVQRDERAHWHASLQQARAWQRTRTSGGRPDPPA